MTKKTSVEETTAGLRLDYLMAASYYWYKAVGGDEQLVSALQRMKAGELAARLQGRVPTPDEVRAFAIERFPAHKLHS